MTFRRLLYLIGTDHYRYYGAFRPLSLLKDVFFNRGFSITLGYRVAHWLYQNNWRIPLRLFSLFYFQLQTLYSCELPYQTRIGPGFYFGHVFGTVISARAVLGKNINMSQAVTIGIVPAGPRSGAPFIGDNVYIAPGAKLVGGIRVGRGSAIGANAVVIKSTPDNAVVVGIPGKVISLKGSADYVLRTVENHLPSTEPDWLEVGQEDCQSAAV